MLFRVINRCGIVMINWKAAGVGATVALILMLFLNYVLPKPQSFDELLTLGPILVSLFAVFGVPLLAGAVSGTLVAKKNEGYWDAIKAGVLGIVAATLLLSLLQLGGMLIQDDSSWAGQHQASILLGGEEIYRGMTLAEYKSFVLFFEAPLDIGVSLGLFSIIALAGALIGWKLSGEKGEEVKQEPVAEAG